MRLHDGKHGHRFTFYSALLIASRHFWANLYSRAWARLLDLWGLAGHWPPTPIAPFDGGFSFLLLDASFDTRFSTCTRDSGYIPGVGNLWWNFNGFGHLLAKVASSDGGGLRIHWLDVIHLMILGFCFFLVFSCFSFLSLFLSCFFQFSTFPSLLHSERCCTTNQTQAAQAAVGAVIGRSPKSNRRSGLGHWMFPDY